MTYMPEHDDHAACRDFDLLGTPCPFHDRGHCLFSGAQYYVDVPESEVCDKTDEAITLQDILRFGMMEVEQWESIQRVRKSAEFKRWMSVRKYYSLPTKTRREEEESIFFSQTYLSKRTFRKLLKPNEIGVGAGSKSSFRTRALDYLNKNISDLPEKGGERVSLSIVRVRTPRSRGKRTWFPKFHTRGSVLERAWPYVQAEISRQLNLTFRSLAGTKILVEWTWAWTYHNHTRKWEVNSQFIKALKT